MKRLLVILALVLAGAAGISLATWVGHDDKPLPYHPGQRGFQNVTTVISGTTYVCTSPCVTETLGTDGRITDRLRAVTLIDAAVEDLRLTTISGKKFCLAMAGCHGTGYVYRGGAWYRALGKLVLAMNLSAGSDLYNVAGAHLIATTATGVAYFADPTKYAGGHWDLALQTLERERAFLVANPLKTGPSIYTK